MFINFWYPVGFSETITDQPVQVRMLGQDFAVFRDTDGKAHCLSDVCVHRGGSLAHGKIKGDNLECPYHGWQFDGGGACRRIPSMGPDVKIPTRAKIDAYPTQEIYGMVFAFLGDLPEEKRPPLNTVKEWDQEGWRGTWVSWEWNANSERAVENSLDPAHNEFVHPTHGFQGEREGYKVPDLTLEDYEWGANFRIRLYSPGLKEGELQNLNKTEGEMDAASGHFGPNSLWNQLHITPTNWMHQYQFMAPIDETHSRFFLLNMRNCWLEPEKDAGFDERNRVTSEQDRVILERLRPILPVTAGRRENLTPSDAIVARYRENLRTWEAKGWRIDCEEVNRNKGKAAYAIPSPARRESKGWALDAMPLVAPKPVQESRAAE